MGIPTHEDAKVLLDLYRLRWEPSFVEALNWFLQAFEPTDWETVNARLGRGPGAERLQRVLQFYDLAGSLVINNLVNDDVLFEWFDDLGPIWARVEPWLAGLRAGGQPQAHENLALLVQLQARWARRRESRVLPE